MGIYDSSKTRVNPLMDYLKINNKLHDFLSKLLANKNIIFDFGTINKIKYDCVGEKTLKPLKDRLLHAIKNFNETTIPEKALKDFNKKELSESFKKRKVLLSAKDNDDIYIEAINYIESNYDKINQGSTHWAILEGFTHPDIFIETSKAYFIGEAKRTESGPTLETTWSNNRDQLIRHIEPLLKCSKPVFHFMIWEPGDKHYRKNDDAYMKYFKILDDPKNYVEYLKEQVDLELSYTAEEIANNYLGHFEWNKINDMYDNQINFLDEI